MENRGMEDFITKAESDLSLCKKLMDDAPTSLNEASNVNQELVQYSVEAIKECELLVASCSQRDFSVNRVIRFHEKVKRFNNFIKNLENKDFSENSEIIRSAEEAIAEYKKLNSSAPEMPICEHYKRLSKVVKDINELIFKLKSKTILINNTKVFDDDILSALDIAAQRFKLLAF